MGFFGNLFKKSAVSKYNLPVDWKSRLDNSCQYTPDMWKLEQYLLQNVFIYDGLMKNYRGYNTLIDGKATRLAAAFTAESNYVMWKKKRGLETFPFVLETNEDMKLGSSTLLGDPLKISGELYTMSPNQIRKLDIHMLNTLQFERKRVKITIPYREVQGKNQFSEPMSEKIGAWMYVGKPEFWLEQIDHTGLFGKVRHYEQNTSDNKTNRYYFFNEKLESNSR